MKPSKQQKSPLITPEMVAERDRLRADLATATADLETVQSQQVAAEAVVRELDARHGTVGQPGDAYGRALREASACRNAVAAAKSRLSEINRALPAIEARCEAPAAVERAEAALADARASRTQIEEALAEIVLRQASTTSKDTELAARIAAIDAANGTAVALDKPADLTASIRAEAERRAVRSALAQLAEEAEQHRADIDALRERERAARDGLRYHRTVVAGLERDAALRPVLGVLVKAAIMAGDDPRRIEVRVPDEVIAAVEAEMTEPGA